LNETNFKSIIHPKDHYKLKEISELLKEEIKINSNNEIQLGKQSIKQINEFERNVELRM